jgi:hypothetical protein
MSQAHIRERKQSLRPIISWRSVLGLVGVLAVSMVAYLAVNWVRSLPSTSETATAKILEIRKVVDHTQDSLYGGRIIYRAEAHVQYVADNRVQDRWLRVSDGLTQDSLLLKLAAHPTECLVHWSPNHPENARCSPK